MVRLDRERLQGEVEIDETYLGGAEAGVRGRQPARKSLVVAAVELDGDAMGRIRLRHTTDAWASSLGAFVRDCAEAGQGGAYRRVEGLRWLAAGWVRASGQSDALGSGLDGSGISACPLGHLAVEALVTGNPSRKCRIETPAGLSRRVHVSVQPVQIAAC